MKKNLVLLFATLALIAGCEDKAPEGVTPAVPEKAAPTQPTSSGFTGTVVEAIKADRYTYVQVDTGLEKIWTATPVFNAKVGDTVAVPRGLALRNFHSKSLERDFEMLHFANAIMVVGNDQGASQQAQIPAAHPPMRGKGSTSRMELSGIEKAKNGKTVAEIFAGKEELAGKEVLVRGKVVKFLPKIMGKNWLHVQDGSGSKGTNDLTITTNATVKVGDTVLIGGVVSVDRDFGFGYRYEVILEDAEVTVE